MLRFPGLGICIMTEFGRFLNYNLLVDDEEPENADSDSDEDTDGKDETKAETVTGYKQMIIILQSQCVETGKSFFCELLSRLFHGRKQDIHSVLSFESAKVLLSKGEPVIIGKLTKN